MNQGNTDNNATKTEAKDFFQFSGDFFVITLTTIAFYFGDLGLKRKKIVKAALGESVSVNQVQKFENLFC